MLLLWPGWVRRKREDDLAELGRLCLLVPTILQNSDSSINKISSTSYWDTASDIRNNRLAKLALDASTGVVANRLFELTWLTAPTAWTNRPLIQLLSRPNL